MTTMSLSAARDAVEAVRSGSEIRVTVKSDEETTRVVAVSAMQSAASPKLSSRRNQTSSRVPGGTRRRISASWGGCPWSARVQDGIKAQHFVVLCITAAAAIWFLI